MIHSVSRCCDAVKRDQKSITLQNYQTKLTFLNVEVLKCSIDSLYSTELVVKRGKQKDRIFFRLSTIFLRQQLKLLFFNLFIDNNPRCSIFQFTLLSKFQYVHFSSNMLKLQTMKCFDRLVRRRIQKSANKEKRASQSQSRRSAVHVRPLKLNKIISIHRCRFLHRFLKCFQKF